MQLLLVEDNSADAALVSALLAGIPDIGQITRVSRLAEAVAHLRQNPSDLILLDLNLPDSQGLDTLNALFTVDRDVPVVIMTGLDDEATALAAIRNGAQDYLVKGTANQEVLGRTLHYAVERQTLQKKLERAMRAAQENELRFKTLVTKSPD